MTRTTQPFRRRAALVFASVIVFTAFLLVGCGYSLSRDRAARIAAANEALGAPRIVVVRDVFVFVDGGLDRDFDPTVAAASRALDALLHDRFSTPPSRAVSVYLFPDARPYEAFCERRWATSCPTPFGFYDVRAHVAVIDVAIGGVGTMLHELVHPLVEADYPTAPLWLDEGLAALYEAPSLPRPLEIHGVPNARNVRLLAAIEAPSFAPRVRISRLFALDETAFRDADEQLHYALARTFLEWLDERGALWPFYRRLRNGMRAEEALVASIGMSLADAQKAFEAWVAETT